MTEERVELKKVFALILMLALALAGCGKASDKKDTETKPIEAATEEKDEKISDKQKEDKITIGLSKELEMKSSWTILDEYSTQITKPGADDEDRIILATSAGKDKSGEMLWDDSNEWALAVLTKDGAYNLFSQRVQLGDVFFEVSTAHEKGVSKEVITVYVFAESENKIYNFTYDEQEDAFVREEVFSTSREGGNIDKIYSSR